MGLADELRAPPLGLHRGQMCTVRLLLDDLETADPEGAAALREVLAGTQLPASTIARRLQAAGWPIGVSTMQRHRRGECRCP